MNRAVHGYKIDKLQCFPRLTSMGCMRSLRHLGTWYCSVHRQQGKPRNGSCWAFHRGSHHTIKIQVTLTDEDEQVSGSDKHQ
jgi:hypothetical protein